MGIVFPNEEDQAEDRMLELRRLAETAGAEVAGEMIQHRTTPDKTFFIGKGKAEEVSLEATRQAATLLIMDSDLSPAQARNLEQATGLRVVERSQLIMDIFASGARTLQARKQVELAQMQYSLPRLKRLWSHLSRIRSGIGMRGPGETQLEVDRRIVRRKIGELKRELKTFETRKRLEIDSRKMFFKVCLVGYTNSGKSTALNSLTDAGVEEADRLFSTLDTRTRKWKLEGSLRVLLSDTVGFIRNLPHHLVASFHATLEEAATADLLLHVVDASHRAALDHIEAVDQVLNDIGSQKIPRIMVFNKTDLIDDFMETSLLLQRYPKHVLTSMKKGKGLEDLAEAVSLHLLSTYAEVEVDMHVSAGKLYAFLASVGDIIMSRHQDDRQYTTARIPPFELGRLKELAYAQKAQLKIHPSDS
ncbi:MAG: GTPase HflX [Planctomycetota bacterium]